MKRRTEWDGMLLGDGKGGLYRVFDPPWWRLGRWIGWGLEVAGEWFAAKFGPKLAAKLGLSASSARGWVDVNGRRVRVRVDRTKLPNVPRKR